MTKNFNLEALDRDYLFHPITNLKSHITDDVLILERGEGIYIFDKDGKKLDVECFHIICIAVCLFV